MRRLTRTARRARCDDGFTLIEIILAMFLVVLVMTAVLGLVVSSLGTLAQARQRQAGAALATQSLESLRALPYETVTGGSALGCTASLGLASTSVNVTAGSPRTLTPPTSVISIPVGESLLENTQSPCVSTVQGDNTTYTIRQYVTRSTTSNGFNLTAIATWPKFGGGQGVSAERSTTYSPGGCLLDTLHPFSGPCQAAYSARGTTDAMTISVTRPDPNPLLPSALVGTLSLPAVSTNAAVEQSVTLTSTALGAGASGATGTGAPEASVRVANSDPTSTSLRLYSGSPTWSGGSVFSSPLTMTAAASSGSLAGNIAADTATCLMPTSSGGQVAISTGTNAPPELRPCGYAKASLAGAASLVLPSARLIDISGVSGFVGAAHIFQGSTGGVCGATAPGCARAAAYRSVASIAFARGVPAAASLGIWQITGLQDFALAERGAPASTPSGSRAGTLQVWNGVTHVSFPLTSTTEQTWTWGAAPVPPAVISPGFPAVTMGSVTITGSLKITKASSSTLIPTGCLASACLGTRQSGTITGNFTVISPEGTFDVNVNIGGVAAVAGYQAAPVG